MIDAERDIQRQRDGLEEHPRPGARPAARAGHPKEKEAAKAETPPIAATATIEVTPQQAEMVTLGQTLGDLSLALNSVRDGGDPETDSPGPIDLAGDGVEPAAARLGLAASSLLPRRMTIDSDVTSLLPAKVQVVPVQSHASSSGPRPPQRPPAAARPARHRRRRPSTPPPTGPQKGMSAVYRHRPLAVALAAAFVILPASWAVPTDAFELVAPEAERSVSLVVGTGQLIRVDEEFPASSSPTPRSPTSR